MKTNPDERQPENSFELADDVREYLATKISSRGLLGCLLAHGVINPGELNSSTILRPAVVVECANGERVVITELGEVL